MTTFATIDIANLKVTFHATSDDAIHVSDQRDHYAATCQEDLIDLSGSVMVALYNATAADIDSNITPVNKFANKETGAKRLWANLVDLQPIYAERVAALEKARQDAAKGPANEAAARLSRIAHRAARADTPKKQLLKDKHLEPAKNIYQHRPGTVGARAVELLSRPGGISVAEFVDEINKVSINWTRSGVWSSLRYILHVQKGYGLSMVDEVLKILE